MMVWKKVGIFAVSLVSMASVACGGSDGATGPTGAAGAAGAAGDKGDTGPAGTGTTPSVGVIVPNIGLLDREVDVTVTAQAVDFTAAAPTFDFGAGVKTSGIQVLSATTAYVHLTVDVGATTGVRDVKVTSGSNNLTSKGGFTVAAPLAVTVTPGLEQGQLALVQADNLDLSHAFDPNGFELIVSGFPISTASTTATHFANTYLVDPAATKSDTVGANVDHGYVVESYAGDSLTVKAHAPTTVTPGTPVDGTIATKGVSNIYKFSATDAKIYEVTVTDTGAKISSASFVYGDAGTVDTMVDNNIFSTSYAGGGFIYPALANKAGWLTVLDGAGGGGAAADYGYTVDVQAHAATVIPESATAHATFATATQLDALPLATTNNGVIISGSLAASTDQDWFVIDLAAGDSLEITPNADFYSLVELTDAAKNTLTLDTLGQGINYAMFSNPATGTNTPSEVVSESASHTALTAGKYYVHVSSGDSSKGSYTIALRKR